MSIYKIESSNQTEWTLFPASTVRGIVIANLESSCNITAGPLNVYWATFEAKFNAKSKIKINAVNIQTPGAPGATSVLQNGVAANNVRQLLQFTFKAFNLDDTPMAGIPDQEFKFQLDDINQRFDLSDYGLIVPALELPGYWKVFANSTIRLDNLDLADEFDQAKFYVREVIELASSGGVL